MNSATIVGRWFQDLIAGILMEVLGFTISDPAVDRKDDKLHGGRLL